MGGGEAGWPEPVEGRGGEVGEGGGGSGELRCGHMFPLVKVAGGQRPVITDGLIVICLLFPGGPRIPNIMLTTFEEGKGNPGFL